MTTVSHTPALEQDLEGTWKRRSAPGASGWDKHLPIDVVRHVPLDLAQDLQYAASGLVADVEIAADAHVVRYDEALQRLNWSSLLALCPQGAARDWAVAIIGARLAGQLEALHDAQLPQAVVHPGRIGVFRGELVLIPTAAAPLPKFSQLNSAEYHRLVEYLAPELLRTRAFVVPLLYAADVYSLGRLLANLVSGSEPDGEGMFARIETRAEGARQPAEPGSGESLLAELINRMCAPAADARPQLAEVVKSCQAIAEAASPFGLIEAFNRRRWLDGEPLTAEEIAAAHAARDDCRQSATHKLLAVSDTQLQMVDIDLLLLRQPPEPGRAIPALEQFRRGVAAADVHLRLARAYSVFDGAADHLERGLGEYALSAELSGWNEDIIAEWCRALATAPDPGMRLRRTHSVPAAARPLSLIRRRIEWWRDINELAPAWHEIAAVFPRVPFDSQLFQQACDVAQRTPEQTLKDWLAHHQDETPEYAAPKSIVWKLLQNHAEAERLRKEAEAYQPSGKTPPC